MGSSISARGRVFGSARFVTSGTRNRGELPGADGDVTDPGATMTDLSWFRGRRTAAVRKRANPTRSQPRKRRFSAAFVPGLPQHELRIITAGYPAATGVKPQPHRHTPHVPFVCMHTCRCGCNSPELRTMEYTRTVRAHVQPSGRMFPRFAKRTPEPLTPFLNWRTLRRRNLRKRTFS